MIGIRDSIVKLLVAAAAAGIVGCSSTAMVATGNSDSPRAATADSGTVYHMQLHRVMDDEGTHKLAFTYLIPEGWTATDKITWIPNDFMTPEVGVSTVRSSDGQVELDSASGVWTNYSHSPSGDVGQHPPKSVSDLLVRGFKQTHPDAAFEVLEKSDTPVDSLLGTAPPQGSNFGLKGVLRLRFSQNGRKFLTKMQGRLDGMQMTPVETGMGQMYEGGWRITETLAVTAPEEGMSEAMKVAGIILTSSRLDPHFFNTVLQAQKIISDAFYSQQRQIAQISQIISRTNDEISDQIMSSYRTGQAVEDKEISGFDDYIRGVDKYRDSEGAVDLPSGYEHAWSDGNGRYIVTEQHGYDPNVGSVGATWHEMEKSG